MKIVVKKVSAVNDACSGRNYNFRCRNVVFGVLLLETTRTPTKNQTNLSTNSGKATERLNRLGPKLAHMWRFIWEWIQAKQISIETQGGHLGVLRGSTKIKSLGKLSKGWTDWHQLWFTSVYSSGHGHRLNTSRPLNTPGDISWGFRGSQFKSLGKLSNVWTDWHQL